MMSVMKHQLERLTAGTLVCKFTIVTRGPAYKTPEQPSREGAELSPIPPSHTHTERKKELELLFFLLSNSSSSTIVLIYTS